MIGHIVSRILAVLPVFLIVAFVSFGIVSLYPGDYFTPSLLGFAMSGQDPHAMHTALRIQAGIDKPFFVQFWIWFAGIVTRGDFGISFSGARVSDILFSPSAGLHWTLLVTGCAMLLAWLFGVPLGVLSAVRHKRWPDFAITSAAYIAMSIPPFTLVVAFFWCIYKWINPLIISGGVWGVVHYDLIHQPMSLTKLGSHAIHLLPAIAIVGAPMFASVLRHMKHSMMDELPMAYLETARGKGISELRVLAKHAARNALNPLVSLFGIMLPTLITGSIITAQMLGIPDFGMFFLRAVRAQDQHVLTAALLFYACFLIAGNLLADLLLILLDPRIRYG